MTIAPSPQSRNRERFYDSIAGEFDAVMNRDDLDRRLGLFFDELLPDNLSGLRLLDGGSGTGWFSRAAARRGAEVVSLDISLNLLREVGKKCRTARVAGSVLALPLSEDSFDVVLSTEVIEHTPDPMAALPEFFRVLKPGGRLVLSCPNWTWKWSCHVANWLGLRPYEGLENWPSYWALPRAARAAGFDVQLHLGFHLVPPHVRPLAPLRRWADTHGQALGVLMVNQALVARKRPEPERSALSAPAA